MSRARARRSLLTVGGAVSRARSSRSSPSSATPRRATTSSSRRTVQLDSWVDLPGPLDFRACSASVIARNASASGSMVYVAQPHGRRGRTACRPPSRRSTPSSATTSSAAGRWTTRWPASGFHFPRPTVLLHIIIEPDRLHPTATNSHETIDVGGREMPAFAPLRVDGQHLDPAYFGGRPVRLLQRGGHPRQGLHRLHEEPDPRRCQTEPSQRRSSLLELVSNFMRLLSLCRATVRQHPCRPPDHSVHVQRPRGAARPRGPGCLHPPCRRRSSTS